MTCPHKNIPNNTVNIKKKIHVQFFFQHSFLTQVLFRQQTASNFHYLINTKYLMLLQLVGSPANLLQTIGTSYLINPLIDVIKENNHKNN